MALNFIRSRSDYKKWLEAINITKKRKAQRNPEDPNYDPKLKPIENVFAYANWLYHNVLSEGGSAIITESEIDCPIKTDDNQNVFNWLQEKVFNEESIVALDETKKWELVEDLYTEFVNKTPAMPMDKLEEFVNTQFSHSPANSTVGALYGLGGYRDTPPIGPIVYGSKQVGLNPLMNPDGSKGDPAVVVIPDKKSNYDPNAFKLDTMGNVVSDVEQSVAHKDDVPAEETEQNPDQEDEDTMELFNTLQELGYTQDQLQNMDDEELHNASKKAIKVMNKNKEAETLKESVSKAKTVKQKLLESFIYNEQPPIEDLEEASSPTSLARQILANKFKVGKAIKKGTDNKYILNQDEISKLIRSQGYTWRRKYNKWVRKSSPTFWGRKLLSGKFQDQDAVKKDENNQYILNQDAISQRLNQRGYYWDMHKKMWLKAEDAKDVPNTASKPKAAEPEKAETTQTEPVAKSSETKPDSSDDTQPEASETSDYEAEDDSETDSDKELDPLADPSIIAKMKLMQARLVLGVTTEKPEVTLFNTNENKEDVPVVADKDILEKINNLGYTWDDTKKMWLDQALSMPKKLIDIEETRKSVLARSLLAAIDSVNAIKVNASGLPSIKTEKLDTKMDKQGYVWNTDTNNWKFMGDDVSADELDSEKLNEVMLTESVSLEEKAQPLKNKPLTEPKQKYNTNKILDAQSKLLLRAIQYDWYKKAAKIDKTAADQTWLASLADGKDGDPFNGHMKFDTVYGSLNNAGYSYNNDKQFPMITDKSKKMPVILHSVGVQDEKEYIARSILAEKEPDYVRVQASDKTKPKLMKSGMEVENDMSDNGYNWNEEWGWTTEKNASSKADLDKQKWLEDRDALPWNEIPWSERNTYKEYKGYATAAKMIKKDPREWDKFSYLEKRKAMNKLEQYYEFDKNRKEWVKREKPLDRGFLGRLKQLGRGLLYGAKKAGEGIAKAAPVVKNVADNLGRYN